MTNDTLSHEFEHLSCFLPGLLALGVYTLPELSHRDKDLHMWAARGLAYTLAQQPPPGPPPGFEEVPATATDRDYYACEDAYLLRQEPCMFHFGFRSLS